jgi:hypothetical protein
VRSNLLKTRARRTAGIVVCAFLLAPFLRAQDASDNVPQKFWRRFSLGVRINAVPMGFEPTVNSSTNPNGTTSVSQTTSRSDSYVGGGVTLEVALSHKLLMSADLLYHHFGYTADTTTMTTAADGTSQIIATDEVTRARYWDLPVIFRVTNLGGPIGAAHFFLGGGASVRRVSNIRTTTTTSDTNGDLTVDYAPRTPLNRTIYGVVAAVGVRAVDDFGIRVTPELRYIRWLGDIFGSAPAQQRRNELQVLIGITF